MKQKVNGWKSIRVRMRSSKVVRTSGGCRCLSLNSLGFDFSILRHSGICEATDEAVLKNINIRKNPKESKYGSHYYKILLKKVSFVAFVPKQHPTFNDFNTGCFWKFICNT